MSVSATPNRQARPYWHQPSGSRPAQETAQLPTLLQADSSALRTDCFQSQLAQPASNSNTAIETKRVMARPS
jgi:hypothetical protein